MHHDKEMITCVEEGIISFYYYLLKFSNAVACPNFLTLEIYLFDNEDDYNIAAI
jgi:hypothetical protein